MSFFGKAGERRLDLKRFEAFLHDLHEELVRLEFAHYDHDNSVRRCIINESWHDAMMCGTT